MPQANERDEQRILTLVEAYHIATVGWVRYRCSAAQCRSCCATAALISGIRRIADELCARCRRIFCADLVLHVVARHRRQQRSSLFNA